MNNLITFFTCFFILTPLYAQDFAAIFSPVTPKATLNLEGQLSDPARTSDIQASLQLYKDEERSITGLGKWRRLTFKESDPNLRNYDDIEGGLSYRQSLSNNRFWSVTTTMGSASDEAFSNSDVNVFQITGLMKFIGLGYGAINYSNNRTFAKNIPLHGFFYVHTMTRETTLIFGLPFAFIRYPLSSNFTLQYFTLIPWRHNLKITYNRQGAKPYFFLRQSPESFIPSQRLNDDERFYWVRREAGIGLDGRWRFIAWDIASGISFSQEFYVAEDFNDSNKRLKTTPENAGFIRAGIKISFGAKAPKITK